MCLCSQKDIKRFSSYSPLPLCLFLSISSPSPVPNPPTISPSPSPPDSQTVHIFLHVFSVTDTPNNQDFNAIHIAP